MADAEGKRTREERVMRDPALAALIKWLCSAICMLQLAVYIGVEAFIFKVSQSLWQVVGYTALASPPVVGTLFCVSLLKDFYIKKYAMGPPQK